MEKKKDWKLLELLNWTTNYLTEKGFKSARLNAEMLLAHTLGMKRIQLYLNFDKPMLQSELDTFRPLLLRRLKNEPIQYIIGYTEFYGLKFEVNPNVLIPRQETEILVEEAIKVSKNFDNPIIADIGTGSGAISISLSVHLPNAKIYATDISENAISVAKKNAEIHGVHNRINFLTGNLFDVFSNEPFNNIKFTTIVSNPPYIKNEDINILPSEIRNYEPSLALLAGEDGLFFFKKIVESAYKYLIPEGYILFEVGDNQSNQVKEILQNNSNYYNIEVRKDYAGKERVVIAKMVE